MSQFRNTEAAWPQEVRIVFERETLDDDCPDLSWLEADSGRYDDVEDDEERARYAEEDAARLASYGGTWRMIGIRAKATVWVPIGGNSFTSYELTSAGLWGTESDSDEEYLESIYEEERLELVNALKLMGQAAQNL